jgi:beta-lactamase class A
MVWSFCLMDADGVVIEEEAADYVHPTASIGKVFLICEIAERLVEGSLDPHQLLARDPRVAVADSGLWQHLSQDSLPLVDACILVAAVSDNWATNLLLDLVGLEPVTQRAFALGCVDSSLHDRVRDIRTAHDPATLSTGTARELAEVARRIHLASCGDSVAGISPAAGALVEGWLLTGVDLSMVAAPFRLDPLSHDEGDLRLWNKTGSDLGVRADMGVAWTDADAVAYAAIATWAPGDDEKDPAFESMHELGRMVASRMW